MVLLGLGGEGVSAVQSLTRGDWGVWRQRQSPHLSWVRLQLSWVWRGLEGREGCLPSGIQGHSSRSVQALAPAASCLPPGVWGGGSCLLSRHGSGGPQCSFPNARFSWEEPLGISGAAVGG